MPNRFDVLAALGIALIAAGLWFIHPAVSMVVTGSLLLAGAVVGARR